MAGVRFPCPTLAGWHSRTPRPSIPVNWPSWTKGTTKQNLITLPQQRPARLQATSGKVEEIWYKASVGNYDIQGGL